MQKITKQECKMQTKKRFIKSIISTAETCDVVMPWTRGTRRQEFIAKRTVKTQTERKSA